MQYVAVFLRDEELPFKGNRLKTTKQEVFVTANSIEEITRLVNRIKLKNFHLLGIKPAEL